MSMLKEELHHDRLQLKGGEDKWHPALMAPGCWPGSYFSTFTSLVPLMTWFCYSRYSCSSDDLALLLLLLLFLWWPGFVTPVNPVTPVTLVTCLWPCSCDDLALLSLFLWWPITVLVLTCPSHPPRPQSEKLVPYIRTNVYCEDRPLHIYVKTKVGKCCDVWCLLTLGCWWWLPLYGIKIRGIHFQYWNNEQ